MIIRGFSTLSFFKTKNPTENTIKNLNYKILVGVLLVLVYFICFCCFLFAFVLFLVAKTCVLFVLKKESVLKPLNYYTT